MKRIVSAALLLVATLVGAGFVASSPATAAGCASTDVTVVVQFPDRTSVGCASGDPDSGYDALKAAGFPITYATGSGTGAICQIQGFPNHSCPSMPSASAYWAYFHAKPGGGWTYSTSGGGSYNPKPGSVEGWRFGGGEAPTANAPVVSTPTTAPTKAPTKKPTKRPSKTPTTSGSSTPTTPDASVGASTPADPSPSATAPDSIDDVAVAPPQMPVFTNSPTATPQAGPPTKLTEPDDSSSGGVSWIWGVVLLGVLAAGGGAAAVVRRRG